MNNLLKWQLTKAIYHASPLLCTALYVTSVSFSGYDKVPARLRKPGVFQSLEIPWKETRFLKVVDCLNQFLKVVESVLFTASALYISLANCHQGPQFSARRGILSSAADSQNLFCHTIVSRAAEFLLFHGMCQISGNTLQNVCFFSSLIPATR